MKNQFLSFVLLVSSAVVTFAQDEPAKSPVPSETVETPIYNKINRPPVKNLPNVAIIPSYMLELAYNKTSCLIFKSAIRSVDLGSVDIIADKANEVENVLRIKAGQIGFNETNFSVMTADGKFYSFVVNYNENPESITYDLSGGDIQRDGGLGKNDAETMIEYKDVQTTQSEVVANCSKILKKRRNIRHLGTQQYGMESTVRNFYVKDNVMYAKLAFKNKSNINYDLDFIRFFVVDKKLLKETSFQELEITPLYVYNEPLKKVKGKELVEKIFVFQKFTIPNDKVVQVVVGENNGGRTITYAIENKDIMLSDQIN